MRQAGSTPPRPAEGEREREREQRSAAGAVRSAKTEPATDSQPVPAGEEMVCTLCGLRSCWS